MRKIIFTFGLISGLVLGIFILYVGWFGDKGSSYLDSEVIGYSAMIIAFSFIFVGIKSFRDKYNGGVVSFGKAFRIGLGITLVGSTIYMLAWVIDYYVFIPDFMEKYGAKLIREAQASGATGAALTKKIAEVNNVKQMYKNPLFVVLFTYVEVLPVGLVISLIAALILKRKQARTGSTLPVAG